MAITTTIPNATKEVYPYGVNLATATINCALFTSSATLATTSTLYSALDNEVANGNGYTTGGVEVADLAWTGTTTKVITGTIPSWTAASFTFRYAVIYDTDTSKIIGYYDFAEDQQVVQGTVTLSFDTGGLISVTSS